jgi:hypothetical protein
MPRGSTPTFFCKKGVELADKSVNTSFFLFVPLAHALDHFLRMVAKTRPTIQVTILAASTTCTHVYTYKHTYTTAPPSTTPPTKVHNRCSAVLTHARTRAHMYPSPSNAMTAIQNPTTIEAAQSPVTASWHLVAKPRSTS